MKDMKFEKQAQALISEGTLYPSYESELVKLLRKAEETNTPLKVKLGLDPTKPDLHLGHAVVLRKLRMFQDFGHEAILIIGDATATIGDPSGRSITRPALTKEEVIQNAQTYLDQAGKIIDVDKARVVFNGEWLNNLSLADFLQLASKVTVSKILSREDFNTRLKEHAPIFMHELFYPLLQGYDSVAVEADIELGGTDQLFNTLMGRELQEAYEKEGSQLILLMPLLEGTDGITKMSKSFPERCIALTDSPNEMFGKIMKISDTLLPRYQLLLSSLTRDKIRIQQGDISLGNLNPRDAKMDLAFEIVKDFHSEAAAIQAKEFFVNLFQKKNLPDEMPEIFLQHAEPHSIVDIIVINKLADGRNEARRLIQGGAVKVNENKISDIQDFLCEEQGGKAILQVGKRKFLRIRFK